MREIKQRILHSRCHLVVRDAWKKRKSYPTSFTPVLYRSVKRKYKRNDSRGNDSFHFKNFISRVQFENHFTMKILKRNKFFGNRKLISENL